MKARIDGLTETLAAFKRLGAGAQKAVRREVKRAALNVESGAKERAPVDTGRLRNSITHETDADGLTATVGTNVEYAPHQEFGTTRQKAQPFLFPALEQERGPFKARLKAALDDAGREAAR